MTTIGTIRLGLPGLFLMLSACAGVSAPTSAPRVAPTRSPTPSPEASSAVGLRVREFDVVAGSHPHDVAPAPDGGVWYTGQHDGTLGYLDPATGSVRTIPLGAGSAPHGVITGPDGNAWITDGGLDAIVRVDASTDKVTVFPLPGDRRDANLNTAVFGREGILWFTGQTGIFGRLDPATGKIEVFDAPQGRGPYGITVTPSGDVWYASLAGSHIAKIDPATGKATIVEPPTPNQGARRVWSDSHGRIWVSEWQSGQVSVHDPRPASGARGGSPATHPRRTPSTSTIGTSSG